MKGGNRSRRDSDDATRKFTRLPSELELRIAELILNFPDRIDEMETRNEENCRLLARQIARLAEEEFLRRSAQRR